MLLLVIEISITKAISKPNIKPKYEKVKDKGGIKKFNY